MAANHHPSPTMMQMQHQQAQAPGGPPHGPSSAYNPSAQIQQLNEQVWLQIGKLGRPLFLPRRIVANLSSRQLL